MKRNIIIGIVVLALGFIGYFFFAPRKSPGRKDEFTNGDLSIKVAYSQPSKRGRLIFGEAKDGALQPYGKYWRVGANEATQITFSRDVDFSGKAVKAGSYHLYAVPGATTWIVALSGDTSYWGAQEPDYSKDVVRVEVPAGTNSTPVEKFLISFSASGPVTYMDLAWDTALIRIEIK